MKLKRVKSAKTDSHFKYDGGKWVRISRQAFDYRINGNYQIVDSEVVYRKGKCPNGSQDKTDYIYDLAFHVSFK